MRLTRHARASTFNDSALGDFVRDDDRAYGQGFTARRKTMGIRVRLIASRSPWQDGAAERLIGTLRREGLDQLVFLGEAHLRRILSKYAAYYNQTRMRLTLHKDAPLGRAVQQMGSIIAIPLLGGLHHRYVRI